MSKDICSKLGNFNTGSLNSGDCNTGNWNSGDCNSGDENSGDLNSGDRNSGDCNSSHCNSGRFNSGSSNSGNYNSGNYNSSDYNSGYLNSLPPDEIRVFNKPCKIKEWEKAYKPKFLFFSLSDWIYESDMTDKEKEDNPSYKTTGGYLKVYEYKEAFKKSWDKADPKDRIRIKELPNFDPYVFYEISGIKVD